MQTNVDTFSRRENHISQLQFFDLLNDFAWFIAQTGLPCTFGRSMALYDLIRDVKNNSSNFINEKKWVKGRFNWQKGFGAFSYGHSQIDVVVRYIQNQEKHREKKTFKQEYLKMLKKFNVEYDEKYLFEWIEDA